MRKNLEKGFTLIELLAVIIILAVIALIATPIVLNVVDKAKEKARQSSIAGFADAAKLAIVDSQFANNGTIPTINEGFINSIAYHGDKVICGQDGQTLGVYYSSTYGIVLHGCKVELKNTKKSRSISLDNYYFASGKVYTDKNDPTYKAIFESLKNEPVVSNYKDTVLNGSDPELSEGMIPVYYDGNVLKKADITKEWYNYTNKKWANVVLVNDATIKDLPANTPIDESKVLAHLVWIPRYKYAVPKGTKPRSISIVFEDKTISKSNGDATGTNYLTHPAFTFGTTELNGIWVGKFETTGTAANPTVKPNVTSLVNKNISTQFTTAQKFGTSAYGVSGVDAHMMKNTEWGAVAYLSHSIYGINGEITINNINTDLGSGYAGTITGCAGDTVSAAMVGSTTCPTNNQYNTEKGVKASTTGNITGIYDMSGGAWEYVMGNYNNTISTAGFSTMPEAKYFDSYTTSTGIKGDATNADGTNGWYGDFDSVVSRSPWFTRGGGYRNGVGSGAFGFVGNSGSADGYIGFRLSVTN